jgi:hypothetical protein
MPSDHMLLRAALVLLIGAAAMFVSAEFNGFPPLPTLNLANAEPVCFSASRGAGDLGLTYCFDPRTLLADASVMTH